MDLFDFGWAVGLFEGEGSIGVVRGRRKPYVQAQLQSTDEDVVRRFHAIVGVGRVHGPYQYNPRWKPSWKWMAHRSAAKDLGFMMLPYLGIRRSKQVKECLDQGTNK